MRRPFGLDIARGTATALRVSRHALERMGRRCIRPEALEAALTWGRMVHVRGADIYALGRREIARVLEEEGIDLSRYEGLQAVCASDGTVVTTYRNRDFRGLRR